MKLRKLFTFDLDKVSLRAGLQDTISPLYDGGDERASRVKVFEGSYFKKYF